MASAALKTILACTPGRQIPASDRAELSARFEATPIDGGDSDAELTLLFDRPRLAVECAFALIRGSEGTRAGDSGEPQDGADGDGDRQRGRYAIHLAEVDLVEDRPHLEPTAREHADDLLAVARAGQVLVSKAVEVLLLQSSASASRSGGPAPTWAWRHHGRQRFGGGAGAVDIIEVAARASDLHTDTESGAVGSDDGDPLHRAPASTEVHGGERGDGELRRGDRLLRYRILDILGRGGMGVVYRAEDGRLRRQVAIKTLPARLAQDRHYLQRFEREVQAIAAVSHPNIVTLHDVEQDGQLRFLTMELVEGELLANAIPHGGLPLERVVHCGVALADALDAAHRRGIVHRDLKPANVMLTPDGRLKVLDFGLAKLRDDVRDTVTDPGQMVGTLAYMAPEQIRGLDVDARSDLFSLGVLLYEMATGRRPFRGQGAALMYAVLHHEPESLGDLSPALGSLIEDCLRKEPEQRIASAEEVRHRLQAISREAAPGARNRPAIGSRLRTWGVSAAAVALGVAATAAVYRSQLESTPGGAAAPSPSSMTSLRSTASAEPAPRILVLPCQSRGDARDPFFAAGLTMDITSRLSASADLEVISYSSALAYEGTDRPPEDIAGEVDASHLVTCEVVWPEDGRTDAGAVDAATPAIEPSLAIRVVRSEDQATLIQRTLTETREDLLELQAVLARGVASELASAFAAAPTPQRARVDIRAHSAYLRGLHQSYVPDYSPDQRRKIIRHFEEAVAADAGYALAWAELAKAHALFFHLRHDMSQDRVRLALAAAARARELEPDSPRVRLAEGLTHYWAERRYDEALKDLSYAAERLPSEWEVYASMAWIHRRRGDGKAAWRELRRALSLNPRDAILRTHIGITATWLRRYPEARALLESAIAEAPDQPLAFWLLAWTHWLEDGGTARARQVLEAMPENDPRVHWFWFRQLLFERKPEQAIERIERIEGHWIETTDFSAPKALARAVAWDQSDDRERAAAAWSQAVRELREAESKRSSDPRLLAALCVAEAANGHRDAALDAAHRAIAIRPLDRDAYEGPAYIEHLAWVHLLLGDDREARRCLDQLLAIPSRLSAPLIELDPRWDPLRSQGTGS
ncbi:MAG: protein kinase [Acidobacteriota bacterium]